MFRMGVTALMSALLAGCGAFVPVIKPTPEALNKANAVPIIGAGQRVDYQVLTIVEGHSCQNKLTDPPATRVGAIEQVRLHALEAGATAIANLQCGQREGTSTRTNCWELISCTAEAVKISK